MMKVLIRKVFLCSIISSFLTAQPAYEVGSGNALSFDGVDDRVNLGPVFNNLSLPVTISAWVKPVPSSTILNVFSSCRDLSNWHGVWLHVRSNRINAGFGDGSGGFSAASRRVFRVTTSGFHSEWNHVAAVITSNNDIRIFINGEQQTGVYNGSASTMQNTTTGEADIGYHRRGSSAPNNFYQGEMDELQIFDIALTTSQIRDLMCRKINPSATGILAAWDFNEAGVNNFIDDLVGTRNGTRQGGMQSVRSGAPIGDRSIWAYNSSNSIGLDGQNMDTVWVRPQSSNAIDGYHLYMVDSLPNPLPGQSLPTGLNHYFGTYGVNKGQQLEVEALLLNPPLNNGPGQYALESRNDNSSVNWSLLGARNVPTIQLTNRNPRRQYSLVNSPCQSMNVLGNDTSVCGFLTINAPSSWSNLLWSTGDTSTSIIVSNSGTYILSGTDSNNCSNADTVQVTVVNNAVSLLPYSLTACDSVQLIPSSFLSSRTWSTGEVSPSVWVNSSGSFWLSGTDTNGCFYTDTTVVTIYPQTSVFSPIDTGGCDSIRLNAPSASTNLLWSTGAITNSIQVSTSGPVWLNGTDANGCTFSDTVQVNIFASGNLDIFPTDSLVCDSLVLTAPSSWTNRVWNTGSTSNTVLATTSGTYWVSGIDTNGCNQSDTIQVTVLNSGNVDLLPSDTLICEANRFDISLNYPNAQAFTWSNGASTNSTTVFTNTTLWVEVFFAGNCSVRDTMQVRFSDDREPISERTFTLCPGENLQVDIDPLQFAGALWSDGTNGLSINISTPGVYTVSAIKPDGCEELDTIRVELPIGSDDFGLFGDTLFCAGTSFTLRAPDSVAVRWPNGSDSTFVVSRTMDIRLELDNGCKDTVNYFEARMVSCECDVQFPSAFTPYNQDGLNDDFGPGTDCNFLEYQLWIFDRWGTQYYYSNELGARFDGRDEQGNLLPAGTYLYRFRYRTDRTSGMRRGSVQVLP